MQRMSEDYSKTYRTSKDVLEFHKYRMSSVHQAILDQEIWAILSVDERAGKKFFRNNPVLELGIGSGAITTNLKTKIENSSIVGVDVSKSMLKVCKRNLSENSDQIGDASFLVGDIFHLPFRSLSFDSVLTIRLIPNLEQNSSALQEVARILRPGGQIIFDIYNRMSPMSLLDTALNSILRRKKKPYKHTCDLDSVVKKCEASGLLVTSYVECLFLPEGFVRFVPKQLLRFTMFVDRVVSNLLLLSAISTRIFILSAKSGHAAILL